MECCRLGRGRVLRVIVPVHRAAAHVSEVRLDGRRQCQMSRYSGERANIIPCMLDSREPDEIVRSRSHEVYCLPVVAFCASFVIGGAIIAAGHSDPAPQIVLALAFLVLTGAAIKWSRSCVVFAYSQEALIIRNPLRTRTIALTEVYGFEVHVSPIAGQNGASRTLVDAKRKDGSRITCIGACALDRTAAYAMTGQLNATYNRRPLSADARPNSAELRYSRRGRAGFPLAPGRWGSGGAGRIVVDGEILLDVVRAADLPPVLNGRQRWVGEVALGVLQVLEQVEDIDRARGLVP